MPRLEEIPRHYCDLLLAVGQGAPSLDEKLQLVRTLRELSGDQSVQIDRFLVDHVGSFHTGLLEAKDALGKLKAALEKLTATPWHPAIFYEPLMTNQGQRAVVIHGSSRRVVGLAPEVDLNSLTKGDEVFLANEMNVIMAKSSCALPQYGEVACFQRWTPNGRIVLQRRTDEEVVVDVAGPLQGAELRSGDMIRWNSQWWMAYEKLPKVEQDQFRMQEVPDIGRDRVGGQEANLELLLAMLTGILADPAKGAEYGVDGRQSILLVGSPGCGKTLMARVAAAEVSRMSGKKCHFAVVKPGEFEDPYVGVTQQKIRNCFESLRRAGSNGLAILFLDEIESIGRIRGGLASQHSDKALAALLAELNGFTDRSNVAIIAATNRKDLIDPALLERLSGVEIQVGRPNMSGARQIFEIHLPESLNYCATGSSAENVRRQMIETAVSRLYSPNSNNELCVLKFRDGKTRTVTAREVISGRCFEQICRAACMSAFMRDIRGEGKGLRIGDIELAVSNAMTKLASTLTTRNVHAYLSDLPQDVDVVSVDMVVRKVTHPHRYLNVA